MMMHNNIMYVRFGGMRNTKTWSKSISMVATPAMFSDLTIMLSDFWNYMTLSVNRWRLSAVKVLQEVELFNLNLYLLNYFTFGTTLLPLTLSTCPTRALISIKFLGHFCSPSLFKCLDLHLFQGPWYSSDLDKPI